MIKHKMAFITVLLAVYTTFLNLEIIENRCKTYLNTLPYQAVSQENEIPKYLCIDKNISYEQFSELYKRLSIFSYALPQNTFNSPKEYDYYSLLLNCAMKTAHVNELDGYEQITNIFPLGEYGFEGILEKHIQQTADYYFADNILVNHDRFLQEIQAKHKVSMNYLEKYDLFFIQPSYFPPLRPCILEYDESKNIAVVAFIGESYGVLYTDDGRALRETVEEQNFDNDNIYEGSLEEYVMNFEPKYEVSFNEKMQIKSFTYL